MTTTQQPIAQTLRFEKTVAVIGNGYVGMAAAAALAQNGYPVVLAGQETDGTPVNPAAFSPAEQARIQQIQSHMTAQAGIETLPQSTLLMADGVSGNFTLTFLSGDQRVEKKAGAVVVATDLAVAPLAPIYGLSAAPNVMTLSEMSALLATESGRKELQDNKKTIAFLVGFAHEGAPMTMRQVLENVLAVTALEGCSAYVYVNNLKVAEDGLERLYRQGRDKGAVYFKLQSAPSVTQTGPDITISFHDPVIRNEIELSPDILVVEESLIADYRNLSLAELLRIDAGPAGFLQKENVHRLPVNSNREGVFVVGGARDVQGVSKSLADVDNMVLQVRRFIGGGEKTLTPKAVVDREKCTICLTCFRCCPHGAIYWEDKAVISPAACMGCGICASECPMDAIQLVDYTDAEMMKRIEAAGASEIPPNTPKIVAFCCQNSAYEAGEAARLFQQDIPKGLKIIKVPCAGKVDIHYILNALVEGADGVIVMACHPGNCKSENGNTYAQWRIHDAHQKLEMIGIPKNRVAFATLAANMASDFVRIVRDMEKTISQP